MQCNCALTTPKRRAPIRECEMESARENCAARAFLHKIMVMFHPPGTMLRNGHVVPIVSVIAHAIANVCMNDCACAMIRTSLSGAQRLWRVHAFVLCTHVMPGHVHTAHAQQQVWKCTNTTSTLRIIRGLYAKCIVSSGLLTRWNLLKLICIVCIQA